MTSLLRPHCSGAAQRGNWDRDPATRLRLTVGLRKEGDRWIIAHEHHSSPAASVKRTDQLVRVLESEGTNVRVIQASGYCSSVSRKEMRPMLLTLQEATRKLRSCPPPRVRALATVVEVPYAEAQVRVLIGMSVGGTDRMFVIALGRSPRLSKRPATAAQFGSRSRPHPVR